MRFSKGNTWPVKVRLMTYDLRLLIYTCTLFLLGCVWTQPVFAQHADWQQQVDTRIEVRLDDVRHFLHGTVEFKYVNRSPDTLHYLYFHLYPNAYKTDRTAYA